MLLSVFEQITLVMYGNLSINNAFFGGHIPDIPKSRIPRKIKYQGCYLTGAQKLRAPNLSAPKCFAAETNNSHVGLITSRLLAL